MNEKDVKNVQKQEEETLVQQQVETDAEVLLNSEAETVEGGSISHPDQMESGCFWACTKNT